MRYMFVTLTHFLFD